MQADGSACILEHSANILEHSACILEHSHGFWDILHAFWNILHAFWNILHTFRPIDRRHTDTQTDTRTDRHQDLLSCVFAAKNMAFKLVTFETENMGTFGLAVCADLMWR